MSLLTFYNNSSNFSNLFCLRSAEDATPTARQVRPPPLESRVGVLESNVVEMKHELRLQTTFYQEIMFLLKDALKEKHASPIVGNNSAHGGYNPSTETTPTSDASEDPNYLPIPTPPTSPEEATFIGKKSNTKSSRSSQPVGRQPPTRNRRLFAGKQKEADGKRLKRHGASRYLISSEIPIRLYPELHQNFLQVQHIDNYSQWAKEIGKVVPRGMALTFHPTRDMRIEGIDLCAAAFIFNNYLDQGEVLVRTMKCSLTRGDLRCLEPRKQVIEDVVDLLGAMLTVHSSRVQWFLPTIFSQIATGHGELPPQHLEDIKEHYMGKANRVLKIFIPICSEGHWFLLLIDTLRREFVYLDSLTTEETRAQRRRDIKKNAVFLEEMVDHKDWYDDPKKGKLLCSDFEIVQPEVVQQDDYRCR
ncbi:hypothetical protein PIB30_007359 [Stylosanthes scabra]|uniref:Ubiquitin-like protease family profile domain-containing protein n=1 Tax=Stylosanthes scabra TaxID=79078 RepID=A0ABU6Y1R2_9FABA|nr:hypothetical protein [Stylosanthes scabra]